MIGPHPLLRTDADTIALIEAASGRTVSHAQLCELVARRVDDLGDVGGLVVFLGTAPTIDTVVDYLGLTARGATVALVDPATKPEILAGWSEAYRPDGLLGLDHADDRPISGTATGPARESVLLPTSGTTGNPKFVRLSVDNVVANAEQIASALDITADDRALGHLPLYYSFGLSVLNSHLLTGASVVLTDASALRPEFWDALRDHDVTSLSGVPYSFEMFRRMKLVEMDLPSLRDVTQAGGKLSTDRVLEFHTGLQAKGVRFWVMYGQTEATARISVLPADDLPDHAGSVGFPLPGGSVEIRDPDDAGTGEIIYRGPNVMLGYAESRADLDGSDAVGGELATGDLGRVDDAGRLWITGRSKRIAKVFGTRVSLDDIEARLVVLGRAAAAIDDDPGIAVFVESDEPIDGLARDVERLLEFPPRSVRAHVVDSLPTTPNGKIDYARLRSP